MAEEFYNGGARPEFQLQEVLRKLGLNRAMGASDLEIIARAIINTYENTNATVTTNTADIATKANKIVTINSQAMPYTLQASDNDKIVRVTSAGTITLPDGLDTGFNCTIANVSGGSVTLSATTTLNSAGTALTNNYDSAYVLHTGSNVWEAFGAL